MRVFPPWTRIRGHHRRQGLASTLVWLTEFYGGYLAVFKWRYLDMHYYRCEIPEEVPMLPPKVPVTVEAMSAEHVERMRSWLPPGKAELFLERLEAGKHGLVCILAGEIAYFTWITNRDEYESVSKEWIRLAPGEGYLFDSFCRPEYRGLGLHSFMNAARLQRMRGIGCHRALVGVTTTNFSARWALHGNGLRAHHRVVIVEMGKKKYRRKMKPLLLKWERNVRGGAGSKNERGSGGAAG